MTAYDPALRRKTPLAAKLKAHIASHGPLPVAAYMAACLLDPDHGYYVANDAIGRAGDFMTAPEISQMFGEVLGLWAAVAWQQMGEPSTVRLVEIGPGRGTMMRDMLRAISRVHGFAETVRVELVEASPRLAAIQTETLRNSPIPVHHIKPGIQADTPTILIANEVLDCIPIDQIIRHAGDDGTLRWHLRTVDCDATGDLVFAIGQPVALPPGSTLPDAPAGAVVEGNRTRAKFESLAAEHSNVPFAGVFIDYGHDESGLGDTLQAVRGHAHEHPLTSPGEADLTAQVDFAQVSAAARRAGFNVDGPIPQAELLGRLGLIERASRLMAANPAKASEVEIAAARLMAPSGMGTRFKALGVRSRTLPPLPGL